MRNYVSNWKQLWLTPTWSLSFSAPRMLGSAMKHALSLGCQDFVGELCGAPPSFTQHGDVIWDHLNLYITWRLSERPDLDVEAILNEYYSLFYGPASSEMGAFWNTLEEIWTSSNRLDYDWVNGRVFAMGQNLNQARDLVSDTNSTYRKRVERVSDGVFAMLQDSSKIHTWPLECDFEDSSLGGFIDILGSNPPRPDLVFVDEEIVGDVTNRFICVTNYFNTIRLLPTPLVVTNVSAIEVNLRARWNQDCTLLEAYVCTRTQPEGGSGNWYQEGEIGDDGFGFRGYQHSNVANCLSYRLQGNVFSYGENKPLFPSDPRPWQHARLRFDRVAGTISLYVNSNTTATLTQTNVNLDGAIFNGLWLRGSDNDYDDIHVTFTKP